MPQKRKCFCGIAKMKVRQVRIWLTCTVALCKNMTNDTTEIHCRLTPAEQLDVDTEQAFPSASSMNSAQPLKIEHQIEALEQEIKILKKTAKYRGRALSALSLTVAALAVPIIILIPIFTTDWSYTVGDNGKVSFHVASKTLNFGWLNGLFPPSAMQILLLAAAFSLTGQGDKVGLLLARYIPFVTSSQHVSTPSRGEYQEDQKD